jgi:hypothetical protein
MVVVQTQHRGQKTFNLKSAGRCYQITSSGDAAVGAEGLSRNNRVKKMTQRQNDRDDRTGGRMAIEAGRQVAEWLYNWEWRWWVTLTFSRDIGSARADAILGEYLNEFEATHRDSLTCMIAQEQKTISGSGRPAGRVHFHVLIGSSIDHGAKALQQLWQQARYGGNRTSGAGADVRPYDPQRGALVYLQKALMEKSSGLTFHNLELLSPVAPESATKSAEVRRKLKRCEDRKRAHSSSDGARLVATRS